MKKQQLKTCIATLKYSENIENRTINIRKFDAKNATIDILYETIEDNAQSGLIESNLMSKIKDKGKLLKDWNIDISYGIKTGYNKAFIIDTTIRDELIEQDFKNSEIIKPLIRGRDVQKYIIEWSDKWLINMHNNPPINANDYVHIKQYLDNFLSKSRKKI